MRKDRRPIFVEAVTYRYGGHSVADPGAYRSREEIEECWRSSASLRVRDTPISEEVVAGVGIGAAMVGLRPVVEMMTVNFTLLAMDQIVNHADKLRYMSGGQVKVPLVIRAPEGAGMQLGAQHSQNLEAWFVHVPGLKVVTPSTPYDAKGLLKSAIRDDNPMPHSRELEIAALPDEGKVIDAVRRCLGN